MRLGGIDPSFPIPKIGALSVKLQAPFSGTIIPYMADITQQIEEIKEEIRKTPHHKGTEHYIGKLRARISRLRDKQIEIGVQLRQGSAGQGEGYAVKKHGDATVTLVGPPSVGKSTLINNLTNTQSKVAEYAFTTLTVIPGMLNYKDAYIQIFDIPGIIAGAKEGKGKGRKVLSVARNSDLLLIMCDPDTIDSFEQIVADLEGAGIRINSAKPEVHIDKKPSGGIIIHSNIRQELSPETIEEIAKEMGIKNADITIKEKVTMNSLIDSFSTSRVYTPTIFVINKVDTLPKNYQFKANILPISAEKKEGLDKLKEEIWKKLELIRVYLVRPDEEPSYNNPIVVKKNQTLKEVAEKIGEEFADNKKAAKIWGDKARFPGQEVSLSAPVSDEMQIRFI